MAMNFPRSQLVVVLAAAMLVPIAARAQAPAQWSKEDLVTSLIVIKKLAPLTNDYPAQLAMLNEISAAHPNSAYVYRVRADVKFRLSQPDEAMIDIHRALDLLPTDIDTLDLGGDILATLCRDAEARAMYGKVMEIGKSLDHQLYARTLDSAAYELSQPRLSGEVNCPH